MKKQNGKRIAALSLAASLAAIAANAETLQVGKVEFIAVTNVKMFKFTGAARDFSVPIAREGTSLSSLEIRIPVSELKTGMEIRDKHMRERIFDTADGKTPDVVFKAEKSECQAPQGAEQACKISGSLSFHGETHPYEFALSLKDGKKIEGTATVDVSKFDVPASALAYTGIVVNPNVQLNIEAKLP